MIGLENWTQFGKSKVLYCLFNVNFTNLITKNLDHFRSNPPSPPEQGLRHLVLTSLVYKLFRYTITGMYAWRWNAYLVCAMVSISAILVTGALSPVVLCTCKQNRSQCSFNSACFVYVASYKLFISSKLVCITLHFFSSSLKWDLKQSASKIFVWVDISNSDSDMSRNLFSFCGIAFAAPFDGGLTATPVTERFDGTRNIPSCIWFGDWGSALELLLSWSVDNNRRVLAECILTFQLNLLLISSIQIKLERN